MLNSTKGKIVALVSVLVLLALVGVGISLSMNADGKSNTDSNSSLQKSGRPVGDKAKHRAAISTTTENLIHSSRELASRPNINDTLSEVAEGDFANLPKDFTSHFYFPKDGKDIETLQKASYITLIQLGKALNQGIPLSKKLTPISADATEYIYLDLDAGNAFVPLTIYLGDEAAFSFEFVWVNGEWRFAPYSLVDTVSSADIISGANSTEKK